MTVWRARRAKDRILCGREVKGMGYVCGGPIATIEGDAVIFPSGLKPAPESKVEGVPHFVLTQRAKRQRAAGRAPDHFGSRGQYRRTRRREADVHLGSYDFPWTIACPHCGFIVLVDPDELVNQSRASEAEGVDSPTT